MNVVPGRFINLFGGIIMKQNRILLVEDEIELIKIVETFFKDEGFEVRTAMNGEEALAIFSHYTPDVIISDVRMDHMDGFELLEALRKIPKGKDIPFIFLTIMDDRLSVQHARELGASDYMTKPFDVEDLLIKVNGVLEKSK